jgi:8-oxo-dGTP diphosphatase
MIITNVVAAVIKKENLYFIAKRNRKKHLGLLWEFPGGKVESNESFQEAVIREIYEELNIQINVKEKITKKNFEDDTINVMIHYYLCSVQEGIIKLCEHEEFLWVEKKDLKKYDFVPGDKNIFSIL